MTMSDAVDGFVQVTVAGQTFGIPVLGVQDVIAPVKIDAVPLAPPEVAGSLNLRGRIVTAIDLRRRLSAPPRGEADAHMCVIVERSGDLYALQVDDVGDVLWLSRDDLVATPVTIDAGWRALCRGLHRLDDGLMLILDVDQVLTLPTPSLAA
ncbi:MAG: chemotaxis protein CheW [Caulobacteraceae bacterium]|nr:chemotaxis protein CheW [Caulobacteraceae bacterium]